MRRADLKLTDSDLRTLDALDSRCVCDKIRQRRLRCYSTAKGGKEKPMVLRECLSNWPTSISLSEQKDTIPPRADPNDIVLEVKHEGPGNLAIRLRRTKHFEYTVMVPVPASLQQTLIFDIFRCKQMTLRELGNMRVS